MKNRSSTLTSKDVLRVIEEAKDAELCRNFDLSRDILSPFWKDFDSQPELSAFPSTIQGEFLRLCGVFLSQYGRARGFPHYQIRAKDILSCAADLFEAESLRDKAAEARVGLANCYWFSGEINEYDDILQSVEEEFGDDPGHPVSVQIKLNRLFAATWRRDLKEAVRLIAEISISISSRNDLRLLTQFHNLAGIVYHDSGDFHRNAVHLNEALSIARKANNSMFVAFNLNNLAMTNRGIGNFEQAHKMIEEAISIMESREDEGWIAHAFDTKALIYLSEGEYDKALAVIEKASVLFSKGEDYSGLLDALWTKCLCLLRLDRLSEAAVLFAKLTEVAARQIGQVAVDKFEKLLSDEVYVLRQFPLVDELSALKRSLVVRALRETGGHMAKAVKVLGLRSQQHLSQILSREFPDIYDELGLKRRARRSTGAKKKEPPLELSRLIMPKSRNYLFNFTWPGTLEPQFYYFPKYLMLPFGIKAEAIVAVMPVKSESLFDGGIVLYFYRGTHRIGRLAYEGLAQIFLVDLDEPVFLADVHLLGVPIGYCRVADQYKRTMKFEELHFIKK